MIKPPAEIPDYRKDNTWFVTTGAAVLVLLTTLTAGLWIVRTLSRPMTAVPELGAITTRSIARSVGRVVDERLDAARLRVLLDLPEASVSVTAPANAVGELAKIQADAGLAKPAPQGGGSVTTLPPAGADYLVTAIRGRTSGLSRELAAALSVEDVRRRIAGGTTPPVAEGEWACIVIRWTHSLEGDQGVKVAWRRMTQAGKVGGQQASVAGALQEALEPSSLQADVVRRVAADLRLDSAPKNEVERAATDLTHRLAWGTAAVIFVGLWTAAVCASLWQIWTLSDSHLATVISASVLAVIAGFAAFHADAIAPGSPELLGALLTQLDTETGTSVVKASRVLTGLAAAAIVILFIASASITRKDEPTLAVSQLEGLRTIFDGGAALLVAGTLEIATLYAWAVSGVEPPSTALSNTALMTAGFVGALFSVALTLVYLPAATTLKRRVPAGADGAAALAANGFGDSLLQQLGRLLQLLAPFLAAAPLFAGLKDVLG